MAKTKSEFMLAITQLSAEKNLPREIVLGVVEAALVSAFRKNSFAPTQEITVKLHPETGEVKVFAYKAVVEEVTDPDVEISLSDAKKIDKNAQLDGIVTVEATPQNAGRIAAQTAKQVVLQRLREAERELVFEEFSDRESEIVTGVIQRVEPRQIVLDLGRTEGILPAAEQVRTEHYRMGQRLKAYILEVHRTSRGPQVIVSRTHRNLLRRLLELEIPEIHSGIIELKAIAREAGFRSKVAVSARQPGIDAIGSCVGLRGIRIQNIVNELNGEKIDVVEWHEEPSNFIANALSPAQVVKVDINEEEKVATVVVPDRQLSLAIGKEGQNARLAARLTGWRIDIKSSTVAEAEEAALVEGAAAAAEAVVEEAEAVVEDAEAVVEEAEAVVEETEAVAEEAEAIAEEAVEEPAAEAVEEELEFLAPEVEELPLEPAPAAKKAPAEEEPGVIRFAEDILPDRAPKGGKKKGKKAKKAKEKVKVKDEERVKGPPKPLKARRPAKIEIEDEEMEELEAPPEVPVEEEAMPEAEAVSAEEKPTKKAKKAKAVVEEEAMPEAKAVSAEEKPAKKAKKAKAAVEEEAMPEAEAVSVEEKPAKKAKKAKAAVEEEPPESAPRAKKAKRASKTSLDEGETEEL